MSIQAQPQQQQPQQPAQVYPTNVTNQPPNNSHHSNGNFGTVFIVLAIILVISVVGCLLGRLCNRRNKNNNNEFRNNFRPARPQNRQQQIHNFHPREGDIEFGVDKRMPPPVPSSFVRTKGPFHGPGGNGSQPHANNGNMKDFDMKSDHEEGEIRAAV